MARKREVEESGGAEGGWINTFADLMNLLLCFFVLLFSMSTVDADKYEALITSLSDSINVFDNGGAAVGDGVFVSSGTDQLVSISEYFNQFEKSSTGDDGTNDVEKGIDASDVTVKQATDIVKNDQKKQLEEIYRGIIKDAASKDISDVINVNVDPNYQNVTISLKGAILFDTGKADLKTNAKPILRKIAEMLERYKNNLIKIEGHTDNVPISGERFRNNMGLSTERANSVYIFFKDDTNLKNKKMAIAGRGEDVPVASNNTAAGRARNRRIEIQIEPS